ncbi:MAG: hypothetical protein ABI771_03870 [Betaproteobacteria bacterium]
MYIAPTGFQLHALLLGLFLGGLLSGGTAFFVLTIGFSLMDWTATLSVVGVISAAGGALGAMIGATAGNEITNQRRQKFGASLGQGPIQRHASAAASPKGTVNRRLSRLRFIDDRKGVISRGSR